jgi:hypothetical protein
MARESQSPRFVLVLGGLFLISYAAYQVGSAWMAAFPPTPSTAAVTQPYPAPEEIIPLEPYPEPQPTSISAYPYPELEPTGSSPYPYPGLEPTADSAYPYPGFELTDIPATPYPDMEPTSTSVESYPELEATSTPANVTPTMTPTQIDMVPTPSATPIPTVIPTATSDTDAYPAPQPTYDPYPGVEQTTIPGNNPYPGPDVTATLDNNPYPGPDQSLTPTQEQYTRTPTPTWTPSTTPTLTPTPTPVVLPTLQNTPVVITSLPYQESRILEDGKVNQAIWLNDESGLGLATSKGIFLIGTDEADPEILDAGASIASIVKIPNTDQIAAGGYDSLIRNWDVVSGDFIKYLRGHLLGVVRLSYSPFGQFLTSASDDATVRIWDADGQHLHTLRGPNTRVVDMDVSLNGQFVAAASNQNVHIWNPETAELLHTISQPEGWYTAAAFSPNGQVLVTAYDGRRLETWDTTTWKRKDLFPVNAQVQSLEYNNTGRLLAIAYQDGRIQIRDTYYRLLLADLVGHPKVTGLSFSPNDDKLVSSSADGSIRIWDLTSMKIP